MKRFAAVLLTLAVLLCPSVRAAGPGISAASAILIDGESGRVLYAQNAEEERPIASITKLMTALVAVESHPDLSEVVTIRPEWTGVEGSSMYLKVGEKLYVFHSAAATLSIPPQSSAIVVVRNVDEFGAAAMYHEVEAVTKRDDGELVITTDKGGLYITVSADASVVDYAGQKLSLDQVKVGSRIMAWYSVVLESYPAQAGTSRLMLLPDAKTEPQEGAALPLTLAGKTVDFTARYESRTAMVPVAAVAKELGLDVTYTPDTGDGARVTLANSDFEVTLYIDRSVVSGVTRIPGAVGATGPLNYHKAPYIVAPGTTWAPASLCQMLGHTITLDGTTLNIQ